MGMDLYKYSIADITVSEYDDCPRLVEYQEMQRWLSNGITPDLFEPIFRIDQYWLDTKRAEHGEEIDWDYSDLSSQEHNWMQFADGALYQITEDLITHVDNEGNKLYGQKMYSAKTELAYSRKPFRQYCEPPKYQDNTVTITIGNMTGISDEDNDLIYDILRKHDNSFFASDNEEYLKLTKFYNNSVPGEFFKPIQPGEMIYFCY